MGIDGIEQDPGSLSPSLSPGGRGRDRHRAGEQINVRDRHVKGLGGDLYAQGDSQLTELHGPAVRARGPSPVVPRARKAPRAGTSPWPRFRR